MTSWRSLEGPAEPDSPEAGGQARKPLHSLAVVAAAWLLIGIRHQAEPQSGRVFPEQHDTSAGFELDGMPETAT